MTTTTGLGFEERLNHVVAEAFEHSPDKRRTFLEQACKNDRGLLAAALNSVARQNELEAHEVDPANREPDDQSSDAEPALPRAATTHLDRDRRRRITKIRWDGEDTPEVVAGRYRILGRLGKGGMGLVHRAEDTRLGRTVALKFLLLELNNASEAKARFLREARAASKLDHPNICNVHEIGETEDGRLYIVMASYEGETLKERLKRGPLLTEDAVHITRMVAAGLAKAHGAGIVHRDVKPGNVFLTDDGQVKVLDFGVAKVMGDSALTRTGSSIGTPFYMAPEQALGKTDSRSDLWALGVMLFEMLTGERPFTGANHTAVIKSVLNDEPPRLSERWETIPPPLDRLLERALIKDPKARYQSVEELTADLPVFAEPSNSELIITTEMKASLRRKASLRPFLAGVLLTTLLASGWLYWISHRPIVEPATASRPLSSAAAPAAVAVLPFTIRGGSDYSYLREGMVDLLSTKLDGAGDVRAVDSRALLKRFAEHPVEPSDPVNGAVIAQQLDANLMILGNVFEIAGQLRLDASLYRISRAPGSEQVALIANAEAEGPAEQIFTLVDDLAIQLLTGMEIGNETRMRRLAATTSESFPALKAYLEGESAWRSGRFGDAANAFKTAVSADPGFALAWYRLSLAHSWLMDLEGYDEALERALQHADRLTPDDRRLLEVAVALNHGDAVAAERLGREVLSLRPDDVEAWSAIGELEFHLGPVLGRSMVSSRRSWEQVLKLEPDDRQAHLHLARLEAYEGNFKALAERNKRLQELLAGSERFSELLFFAAMLPGATDDRRALRESLGHSELGNAWLLAGYSLSANIEYMEVWGSFHEELLAPGKPLRMQTFARRHLGIFALSSGRLAEADQYFKNATHPPEKLQEHRALVATLPFVPVADEHLESLIADVEAWTTRPTTDFSLFEPHTRFPNHHKLYLLGLLTARSGDPTGALAFADSLTAAGDIESNPGLARDLELGVRAEVASLEGDYKKVVTLLAERHSRYSYEMPMVSPLFSQSRERFLKAEALFHLDRLEEALGWYESLSELSIFDLVYLAPAHLRQAEIYERLGRPQKALVQYRHFVERWWGSDPQLQPQVEEVRRRLGELSATVGR